MRTVKGIWPHKITQLKGKRPHIPPGRISGTSEVLKLHSENNRSVCTMSCMVVKWWYFITAFILYNTPLIYYLVTLRYSLNTKDKMSASFFSLPVFKIIGWWPSNLQKWSIKKCYYCVLVVLKHVWCVPFSYYFLHSNCCPFDFWLLSTFSSFSIIFWLFFFNWFLAF